MTEQSFELKATLQLKVAENSLDTPVTGILLHGVAEKLLL